MTPDKQSVQQLLGLLRDGRHHEDDLAELLAARAAGDLAGEGRPETVRSTNSLPTLADLGVKRNAAADAVRAMVDMDGATLRLRMNLAEADMAAAVDWRKLAALPSWDEVAQRRSVVLTREQCMDRLAEYGRRCRERDRNVMRAAGIRELVAA